MRVQALGHVVLKVRSLERSVPFYADVIGLKEVARYERGQGNMVFFSITDNHHDVALVETGLEAPTAHKDSPGLAHMALKIGDSLDELREAKALLEGHGVEIDHLSDHIVSKSIYFHDPDGNQLEFFVDHEDKVWLDDPTLVATGEPLSL